MCGQVLGAGPGARLVTSRGPGARLVTSRAPLGTNDGTGVDGACSRT